MFDAEFFCELFINICMACGLVQRKSVCYRCRIEWNCLQLAEKDIQKLFVKKNEHYTIPMRKF